MKLCGSKEVTLRPVVHGDRDFLWVDRGPSKNPEHLGAVCKSWRLDQPGWKALVGKRTYGPFPTRREAAAEVVIQRTDLEWLA